VVVTTADFDLADFKAGDRLVAVGGKALEQAPPMSASRCPPV